MLLLLLLTALSLFWHISVDEDSKESSSEVRRAGDLQAPTKNQPQQPQSSQAEANGGSSQVPGLASSKKPEPPDLADRSSQSSFTSQDGTGDN